MDEAVIYSRWDGSQVVDLEFKAMLDDFFDKFMETGDVNMALEWMMREGVRLGRDLNDLLGLNRMARQLLEQRSRMLRDFNPSALKDQLRQMLDRIVDKELEAVRNEQERVTQSMMSDPDKMRKKLEELMNREATLTRLPKSLREAVDRLKSYQFLDPEAQAMFNQFAEQLEQLQNFMAQNMFGGEREMTAEEAQQMMAQIRQMEELIRALMRGELSKIDQEALARFLGEDAERSIQRFLEFMDFLKDQGYVVNEDGEAALSPEAIRKIGEKALKDIYNLLGRTPMGMHPSDKKGVITELPDQTKPLRFGEPFRPHMQRTVMNAVLRECSEGKERGSSVSLKPDDFEIVDAERWSKSATALLLDMSLSMFMNGRFGSAKKVALAMEQLIRTKFPRDDFYLIGFATVARQLSRKELVEAAGTLGEDIFTNIQDALNLASRLLSKHRDARTQVILITDGQPTAYYGKDGLHVEWPMFGISPASSRHTLNTVREITRQNIVINTFMLDRDPPLVRFVHEMTRINKGRAFFTSPGALGKYLLLDFLGKKKRVVH